MTFSEEVLHESHGAAVGIILGVETNGVDTVIFQKTHELFGIHEVAVTVFLDQCCKLARHVIGQIGRAETHCLTVADGPATAYGCAILGGNVGKTGCTAEEGRSPVGEHVGVGPHAVVVAFKQ